MSEIVQLERDMKMKAVPRVIYVWQEQDGKDSYLVAVRTPEEILEDVKRVTTYVRSKVFDVERNIALVSQNEKVCRTK